jgi:hypothetical protein
MNRFGVYIYFNPMVEGDFYYGTTQYKYEPIYIGYFSDNGKDRYKYHLRDSVLDNNSEKSKILKGFVELLGKERYLSDFVSILHSSSNSNDCEELEKDLIKSIGRKCLNEGPLLNIRPGGEIGSQGNSPYNGSVIYDLELNSEIHITNISEFNTKHDCTINAIVSRFSKDIDGVVKNRFCLTKNKDKFSYLYDNVTLYISNGVILLCYIRIFKTT